MMEERCSEIFSSYAWILMSHIWIYSLNNYQGIHIYKDLSGTNLKGFPKYISLCQPDNSRVSVGAHTWMSRWKLVND